MTPRAIARAVAGVIVLALLVCVWALIIIERCEQNLELNDITWEELAARPAQSNNGGAQ